MPLMTLLAFIFLGASFFSLWIKREPKVWGSLLCLSILSGIVAGNISWIGLCYLICFWLLWIIYTRSQNSLIFIVLVCFGISFKLRFIPGFHAYFISPKFAIGLENPLIGLFPLALVVPLANSFQDFKNVIKGVIFGCFGIAMIAILATITGSIHLDFKMPSFFGARLLSNLVLTAIPEEGFYRGFIQKKISDYFKNRMLGNVFALLITSSIFTLSHILWSPNLSLLAFTFLASLLYGSVYLFSGKIESAIICHFLLNLIHMTFFSYHAL